MNIVDGGQRNRAAINLRADIATLGQRTIVAFPPISAFAVGSGERPQVEFVAGDNLRLAARRAVTHHACRQINVM